ncbi:uncharacterized protein LOC111698890 [Eurytemora carolleeae]|uniref:uncharacterized protein LOC111698890 n=1 Tax=Eurytemora carolleeae TaxID=1294199 RepID=UPI000C757880|nr:uncharacterized protein LOC111698890 [Eurytemora carolleeae]|eukprot:XP_023325129.1 uncharacterized protein LOC111698890 [Eurytemora affinis]
MPIFDSCCFKFSNKHGSIAIGAILLCFTVIFVGVSVGFIAGWESFDTSFLIDASQRLRSRCEEADYVGNCTKREWIATRVDNLQERLSNLSSTLESIGPVWKNEFISLYCFIPWYGLANVLLIIGAWKDLKVLLLVWIVATIITLIWEFVLLAILFSYDTTIGFVLVLAILQLLNFCFTASFILVVFSLYQELDERTLKSVLLGRGENYLNKTEEEVN